MSGAAAPAADQPVIAVTLPRTDQTLDLAHTDVQPLRRLTLVFSMTRLIRCDRSRSRSSTDTLPACGSLIGRRPKGDILTLQEGDILALR
jgi:hypothetical protein